MKLYQTPDFELIRFHQEDVLTDSVIINQDDDETGMIPHRPFGG